jgi:CRISPR-associated protein Csm2
MSIYYEDSEEKILKTGLVTEDAEREAKKLTQDTRDKITSAQLRRFYGEFKGLERKATDKESGIITEDSFRPILPLIKMVKSKVAYASNEKNRKVPLAFKEWMEKHIQAINSARDFEAFLLHFEAVVGFCYGLGLKNN